MPDSSTHKCDVVVIGAGPAGLLASTGLATRGYDTCLLEKNSGPGHKSSCTGIVSRECLALLPGAESAVQYEASSASIFSPSGKCIRVERREAQAYVLDRPALDLLLANKAKDAGVRLFFSTPAGPPQVESRSVMVPASCDGEPTVFIARAAVIATGAGTAITKAAGLGQVSCYASGAQVEVRCAGLAEIEVYSGTQVAPGFFAWLVPAGHYRAKAGLLCRGTARPYMLGLLDRLLKCGKISAAAGDISYGAVPLRPLPRSYGERVLAIGDAAGQAKPTTGGGIYFGALCAGIAAQTLAEALAAGDLSAGRLSTYQRKWHKLLKDELSIDYWAHRFYSSLSDSQVEHVFGVIERHGLHESILASPDINFDWHGRVILDALKYRSLHRSLSRMDTSGYLQDRLIRE